MSQKISKNHHFVPQAILKRFCYDEAQKKLFYYDKEKPKNGVVSRDKGKVFCKRHYYNFIDQSGKKTDTMERNYYSKVDDTISNFLDEIEGILDGGDIPEISAQNQIYIKDLIYSFSKRTPDSLQKMNLLGNKKDKIARLIEEFEDQNEPIEQSEKDRLLTDGKVEEIFQYARIKAQTLPPAEISDVIASLDVVLAFPPSNKQFIIGSNPVLIFENQPGAILGDGNVERWMPFSPKFAFGMTGPNIGQSPHIIFDDSFTRKFNELLYSSSTSIGSANEKLIASLTGKKFDPKK